MKGFKNVVFRVKPIIFNDTGAKYTSKFDAIVDTPPGGRCSGALHFQDISGKIGGREMS